VAMTVTTTSPRADVTLMYLVHDAVRRDLDLLADGLHRLAALPAGPARRAVIRALRRCWADLDRFLHEHHAAVTGRLWPLLRRYCPMTGELLADLSAEHAAISRLMHDCRKAMAL